ncbi:MAG: hypothetical protein AB7G80_03165 [Dongiaceae bacterium]
MSRALAAAAMVFIGTQSSLAQLDEKGRAELLDKYSPIFVGDNGETKAICEPADYVNGCQVLCTLGENFWWLSPSGNLKWTRGEFIQFLRENRGWTTTIRGKEVTKSARQWSEHFEIRPPLGVLDDSHNQRKRFHGEGIFGCVIPIGNGFYSVKYFLFLAYNDTAYSNDEGDHEGDWLCLDLQVRVPEENGRPRMEKSTIEYALYHNHGRVLLVKPAMLRTTSTGRPYAYLEKGTNELWPNAGTRGFGGWPQGLLVTKDFGCGEGLRSEHKVVREHEGHGVSYDTWGKVVNLETSTSDSAWLILNYRGQWGEIDSDDFKGLAEDTKNPYGPPWNPKMWRRSFTTNPDDPNADKATWREKPDCRFIQYLGYAPSPSINLDLARPLLALPLGILAFRRNRGSH